MVTKIVRFSLRTCQGHRLLLMWGQPRVTGNHSCLILANLAHHFWQIKTAISLWSRESAGVGMDIDESGLMQGRNWWREGHWPGSQRPRFWVKPSSVSLRMWRFRTYSVNLACLTCSFSFYFASLIWTEFYADHLYSVNSPSELPKFHERTPVLGRIKCKKRRGTEDEMVGWHHRLDLSLSEGQGRLAYSSLWALQESNTI